MFLRVSRVCRFMVTSMFAWMPLSVCADGSTIDKVYHPYVVPLEIEVEWRTVVSFDDDDAVDDQQLHRLGIGYSPVESWFAEVYLIGEKKPNDAFALEAIEIEAKWQLTEQGEYDADWGVLFEFEKQAQDEIWAVAVGLLVEKEWGRWVGAANLFVEFEWGGDIKSELESAGALQLRYRYDRVFEPALEFYQSENTTGLGPVLMGNQRLGIGRKLHWEFGVIFGLNGRTPNQTVKALLEYEF